MMGFDPQAAVERLGGDLDFYRILLVHFVGDVPALQADLADRSDTTLARWSAACHALKGTAATLGFTALAHASADVEQAFKQLALTSNETMSAPLFDRMAHLSDLVSQARDAAQRWLGQRQALEASMNLPESLAAGAQSGLGGPEDAHALVNGLQSLMACLKESDLQALDLYERLKSRRESATDALWQDLDDAMHDLDFERAAQSAAKLLEDAPESPAP